MPSISSVTMPLSDLTIDQVDPIIEILKSKKNVTSLGFDHVNDFDEHYRQVYERFVEKLPKLIKDLFLFEVMMIRSPTFLHTMLTFQTG